MRRVLTRTESIAELCRRDVVLLIPSYQRPYVWPAEDVSKLLVDIDNARQDHRAYYFIGTLISARCNNTVEQYELIDGQQRITTLVLLALAFRERLPGHGLVNIIQRGTETRLTFPIRDNAQAFLRNAANLSDACLTEEQMCDPYVTYLRQGLQVARQKLKELDCDEESLVALADYFFKQVMWVNNVMPAGVNPNQLFTRINTSGVQLEQSDILKSQLLHKITRHKRRYDAIWQVCENLSNYFERNVRLLFPNANWQQLNFESLVQFDALLFPMDDDEYVVTTGKTIAELARETNTVQAAPLFCNNAPASREKSTETEYCQSIINFPLLLMHTYRIFRAERKCGDIRSRLHTNNFAECFKSFSRYACEEDAIAFIECLWRVRFQFDRWVVKWRQDSHDNIRHLNLGTVSWNATDKRLNRSFSDSSPDLVQLQAVRNFTGERSAQYWLTPFLARLMDTADYGKVLAQLERIDNTLSLAKCTQKEASFTLLQNEHPACRPVNWIKGHLEQDLGTGFEHYWFQKLEYILWKNRASLSFLEDKRLQKFRITSKNSVEHVHPQHHELAQDQLAQVTLDDFGNLALLSPGENSSYSNQDPTKKFIDFSKKAVYDSLKLAHIFKLMNEGTGEWETIKIIAHREYMLQRLEGHYCAR